MAYFEDRAAYRSSIEKWHPARGGEDDYIYIYIYMCVCVCVTHARTCAARRRLSRSGRRTSFRPRSESSRDCLAESIGEKAPPPSIANPLIVLSFAVRPVLRLISGGA